VLQHAALRRPPVGAGAASRLGELSRDELVELVQDAWLSRASARRRTAWLAEHGLPDSSEPAVAPEQPLQADADHGDDR
jgi:hypothetical protein